MPRCRRPTASGAPSDDVGRHNMRIALIAVLVPLLASCASSGLYNMSDEWCAAHLDASIARCSRKDEERRVAANDREHVTDSEVATSHSLPPAL